LLEKLEGKRRGLVNRDANEGFEEVTDPNILKMLEADAPLPVQSPQRPQRMSPSVDQYLEKTDKKLEKSFGQDLPQAIQEADVPSLNVPNSEMLRRQSGQGPVDLGDLGNEFLRSVGEQNFRMYSEALMTAYDATGEKQYLDWAKDLKRAAGSMAHGVAPRKAKEKVTDIRSLQEAIDWAQATMGQGAGSSLPALVGGAGGYAALKPGGKAAARLGAIGGAFAGGAALSIGEMREALVEEGIKDPKKRAELSVKAGLAMAALDTAMPGAALTKLFGINARREVKRNIIQRILQEGAKSAGIEGVTEATQHTIKDVAAKQAAGHPVDLKELAIAALNEGAAGAVGGSPIGAVSGVTPDQVDKAADPALSVAQDPQQPTTINKGDRQPIVEAPAEITPPVSSGLSLEQELSVLIQQGYTEEQILGMPDEERVLAAKEGVNAGITPIDGLPVLDSETTQGSPVNQPAPQTPPPAEPPPSMRPESVPLAPEAPVAQPLPGDGSKQAPIRIETEADIAAVRDRVHPDPSKEAIAADNFRKLHGKWQGLDFSIETAKGGERKDAATGGQRWRVQNMPADYGHFVGTKGADGQPVDLFVGPDPSSQRVFVIDQKRPSNGRFDETKVIVGANSSQEAFDLYERSFSDGSGASRVGAITETTPEQLKAWLKVAERQPQFSKHRRFHVRPDGSANRTQVVTQQNEPGTVAEQLGNVTTNRPAEQPIRRQNPQSFISWIIAQGGIRDDTGELRAMDLHKRPGVVRRGGRSVDEIRELAVESGYINDPSHDYGGEAQTTAQDVYDLIAAELGGNKHYQISDRQAALAAEAKSQAAVAEPVPPEFEEWGAELYGFFRETKLRPQDFNREDLEIAKSRLEASPMAIIDIGDLLERIAIQTEVETNEPVTPANLPLLPKELIEDEREDIADEVATDTSEAEPSLPEGREASDRPTEPEGLPQERQTLQSIGDDQSGTEQADEAVSKSQKTEADQSVAQKTEGRGNRTERTEAGEQTVLPGAERISKAEEAQRQADKPLKAKVAQKSVDEGLFGDEKDQTDLIDRLRKKDVLTAAPDLPKTDTPEFKAWFRNSKVVDENGKPKIVYHGAIRSDRVVARGRFDKKRATSGPMAFFTDDHEIASRYAESKPDTSFERPDHYKHWFKFKPKGMRSSVDIMQAWHFLTPEQRQTISAKLPHVVNYTAEGEEMDSGDYRLGDQTEWGLSGKDHWDWTIRQENRGNVLGAAVDIWLNGGTLINSEEEFMTILRLGGMPMENVTFDSPHATYPGVVPVYLSIQNPLDAGSIPQDVIDALGKASRRTRKRSRDFGLDIWHKEMRDPRSWFEEMAKDVAEGKNTHAWTSIPDWVTNALKSLGYDGIKDKGGKMGGQSHTVWIPFEETQVKSPFNRGTFDPTDPRILFRKDEEKPATRNSYQFVITDKQRTYLKKRVNLIARRILGRTLPDIEFHDTLPGRFQAVFSPSEWMIYMSLQASIDPRLLIRHEAVHVLKKSGLFTDGEWRVLTRMAERKWKEEFNITPEKFSHYKDRSSYEELMIEEAIAEAYLHYSIKGPQKNASDRIFEKLKQFLEAVLNMLKGQGFTSIEGIFEKVEKGKVAKRAEKGRAPSRIGEEVLTAAPPDDARWAPGERTTEEVKGPKPEEFESNINLDYIAAPNDVKGVIKTVGERAEQFITERRGVVSNEQTKALAKELGMKAADLSKRRTGQAFNAHEIYAARVLMVQSASTVRNLASKAAKSKTLHDLAQFQKAFTRHVAIQEQIAGMTAEAGRALQQFKMMTGANYLPIAKAMQEEARSKDKDAPFGAKKKQGQDALIHLAEMVNAIDDPSVLNRFTRDAYKITIFDKVRELWINALLSGPRTHATNILSNFITGLWQVPETAVASTIGMLHGGEKVRAREVTARLIGVIEGTQEGFSKAIVAFKTGEPTDAVSKIEQHRRKAIGGITGEIVRIPSRALLAEDEFFKTLNYRAEINARAARIALSEGKSGKELAKRIAELRTNPTPSMQQAAHQFALYQTFQNQLGPIGRMAMRLRDSIPGVYLLLPFIRTPANLIKYAAERTPFGLAMREVRENLSGKHGNIARDTQAARLLMGSALALTVASWAMAGMLTGSGPDEPKERAVWRNNNQPYSIKIGDTWYSYQRMDPFGFLMGVVADLIQFGDAVREVDASKAGAMIVHAISRNLLNKTWLSGLSDFIEAIQDAERYGERYLQKMGGTLIPTGVAQVAQTMDPVMREIDGFMDMLKTRIPGMGKSLPPRRNLFGEEIIREGSWGPDLLSPIYIAKDKKDPVANAMLEAGHIKSMPSRRINNHQLTPEQYSEYAELAGKAAHADLLKQVKGARWQHLRPDDKINRIDKAFDKAREVARRKLKRKYPDLAKSAN
jgi:hypothetical protein